MVNSGSSSLTGSLRVPNRRMGFPFINEENQSCPASSLSCQRA